VAAGQEPADNGDDGDDLEHDDDGVADAHVVSLW
jgi:hypothetical protein